MVRETGPGARTVRSARDPADPTRGRAARDSVDRRLMRRVSAEAAEKCEDFSLLARTRRREECYEFPVRE